jgi:5-formyltetrahydrofolate cyclo-ligase
MRGPSLAIGLALESQHVPTIPEVPSDVSMDMVVTEKRVLRFARSAT